MPEKHRVVQLRRGTTLQHLTFVGAPGEVTVDTDKWTAVVHDGLTEGGFPLKIEATQYPRVRYLIFRAVAVQQGFGSLGFSAPTNLAPQAVVYDEHGIVSGFASFAPGDGSGSNQSVQDHFLLPVSWVAPLTVDIVWRTSAILGTAIWIFESVCVSIGSDLNAANFGTPQTVSTIVDGQTNSLMTSTVIIDTTNFPSTGELFFRLTRDGGDDTVSATIELLSLRFSLLILEK